MTNHAALKRTSSRTVPTGRKLCKLVPHQDEVVLRDGEPILQLMASIIIPHYNDIENLSNCLTLLTQQTVATHSYEIIVADNNSSCGLAAVEEVCAGRAKVLSAPVQGAGQARNAGVRASRGRSLAFIDSDCRPARDWLERGLEALASADIVGGSVDIEVKDPRNLTPVEAFETVFAFNNKKYVEKKGFSITANMFVPRAVFAKVGYFRTGVSEDKDWGQRAVALGLRWTYASAVRVCHPSRRDWDDLCRKWRRLVRESYLLTKERPFGRLFWALRAWLILLASVIQAVTILRSPKLDGLGIKLKTIGILLRIRWLRFIEAYKLLFLLR
jgi:glycosyltransferase involved in cell wall biosynthesis